MSADIAGPVARALLALETIQGSPGITADALARRLGVSDRAARRYVQTLREADIPIESTPGRYGGYRLGRAFRLPPLMLTTAEALGLLMAVLPESDDEDGAGGDVGTRTARQRAITKILRVLPAPVTASAELLRRVRRARRSGAPQPDPELVAALVRAVDGAHPVTFRYRSSTPEGRRMTVEPWAVVLRHELWYLLCWSRTSEARRLLRVDRMDEVTAEHETFTPPADLDPVAVVEEHLSEGWQHEVVVDFAAAVEEVRRWVPRSRGSLEALPGNGCRLTGTTQDLRTYLGLLVEVPFGFRIVGGAELLGAARDAAGRLLAPATDDEDPAAPSRRSVQRGALGQHTPLDELLGEGLRADPVDDGE